MKDHPGWDCLKFLIMVAALTFLLYGEASNFDETELRVIGQFAGVLGTYFVGSGVYSRWQKGQAK